MREEAPRAEAPAVEVPRIEASRVETPKLDTRELLEASGLQMVETDRNKARPQPVEEERVQLGRPRRERPVVPPSDGELVQVETRK